MNPRIILSFIIHVKFAKYTFKPGILKNVLTIFFTFLSFSAFSSGLVDTCKIFSNFIDQVQNKTDHGIAYKEVSNFFSRPTLIDNCMINVSHEKIVNTFFLAIRAARYNKDFVSAKKLMDYVLDYKQPNIKKSQLVKLLYSKVLIEIQTDSLDNAIETGKSIYQEFEKDTSGLNIRYLYETMFTEGYAHVLNGELIEGEKAYKRALRRIPEDAYTYLTVLNSLCNIYEDNRRLGEALTLRNRQMELAVESENSDHILLAYYGKSRLYTFSDQFKLAYSNLNILDSINKLNNYWLDSFAVRDLKKDLLCRQNYCEELLKDIEQSTQEYSEKGVLYEDDFLTHLQRILSCHSADNVARLATLDFVERSGFDVQNSDLNKLRDLKIISLYSYFDPLKVMFLKDSLLLKLNTLNGNYDRLKKNVILRILFNLVSQETELYEKLESTKKTLDSEIKEEFLNSALTDLDNLINTDNTAQGIEKSNSNKLYLGLLFFVTLVLIFLSHKVYQSMIERKSMQEVIRKSLTVIQHDLKFPISKAKYKATSGNLKSNDFLELEGTLNKLIQLFDQEDHTIEKEEFDLGLMANDIFENIVALNPQYKEAEFIIEDEILVKSDKNLVSIVLVNIIENALKFSELQKRPTLILTQEGSKISIEDNGIGLPSKTNLNEVFKFKRVFHKKEDGSNSGVGLFVVEKIIKKLGGVIRFKKGNMGGAKIEFEI